MEALNAVGLKPISVLKAGPKKQLSFPINPHLKIPQLSPKPHFHGSLVLISSIFNSAYAKALTYEEALNQSPSSSDSSVSLPDVDVSGFIDSVISYGVENPAVVAGGAAVLVVPIILSQVLGKPKAWGVESAKSAYEKLGDDGNAQLLDIRAPAEIRQAGSPDIRSLKKKPVTIAYNGDDKPAFLKKLSLKFKEPENTTLFILDKFDGSSELVAELVTVNGFKAAYAIKDGAEGNKGWMNSGLPWILPKKSFSFDFSSLTDAFDGTFSEGFDAASLVLGITAAAGLGALAFTEVETILEFLGAAAIVQFVTKKFLFAEDRRRTLKEVDEFLTTNVAPNELGDELVEIVKALLPSSTVTSKALPAPTPAIQEEAVTSSNDSAPLKVEPEATPPPPPPEPVSQVNSVPQPEVKDESLPKPSRPLSPYPYYPNLKPPTSPTPSTP